MPAEMGWTLGVDGEEIMAKGADRLREQGQRKRGRLQLRWEGCMRRDIPQGDSGLGFERVG